MPAWFLWSCLVAALFVLPVIAVLVEDRPPRNELTQEQDPGGQDGDGAEMRAALGGS